MEDRVYPEYVVQTLFWIHTLSLNWGHLDSPFLVQGHVWVPFSFFVFSCLISRFCTKYFQYVLVGTVSNQKSTRAESCITVSKADTIGQHLGDLDLHLCFGSQDGSWCVWRGPRETTVASATKVCLISQKSIVLDHCFWNSTYYALKMWTPYAVFRTRILCKISISCS